MSKKEKQLKTPSMNLARDVTNLLRQGNFWMARRLAKIMARDIPSKTDQAVASVALKMTWPDPLALFIGFLCFLFTVIVAYLVAY